MGRKVLAVLHDPGSAAMMLPVLAQLQGRGELDLAGSEFTAPLFQRHGLKHRLVSSSLDEAAAAEWLADYSPSVLLTGTSWNSSTEPAFRKAAGGLKSIAVVDYWANYAERFPDGFSAEICVLDENMASSLRELGASRVTVTGHPQLEQLSRQTVPARPKDAPVLFLSEPRNTPAPGPMHPLAVLSQALPGCRIEFKTHPKEKDVPSAFLAGLKNVSLVEREIRLPEEFASYSLVAGYQSMGLFQAAALGCAAVSFPSIEPGRDLSLAMDSFGIARRDISLAQQARPRPALYPGAGTKLLRLFEGGYA